MHKGRRFGTVLLAAATLATFGSTVAISALPAPALTFTTLGTNSGPIPNPARSEPASFVRYGDQAILVDIGDGAAEQLAKAGVTIGQVQTIIISHLHFDHTGGLFAFLSLRYQGHDVGPLTIYGPPGTKLTVDGLLAAMNPGVEVSGAMGGNADVSSAGIKVVELASGSKVSIGQITVTATENTHFIKLKFKGSEATRPLSLSYRFDAANRSILFTGDTGPSQNVEQLCKGADLLVSEIMDPVAALDRIKQKRPDLPAAFWPVIEAHYRKEHLAPNEVGLLAEQCGARALVLTHNSIEPSRLTAAREAIAAHYKGPITFANDLQVF
jgi:ribonuclease BN (tRNA processing enzyme)